MRRLSRNTLALLISNVGGAFLSFLLSVLIGRGLGREALGIYASAQAWVFPLALLAEFGLGTWMTREIAREPQQAEHHLRATMALRLALGFALTGVLFLAAPLIAADPRLIAGLQISAPFILILPFFGAFTAIFRAQQRMESIPLLNLGMLIAQVILTLGVVLVGGDVMAALVVNTLTSAGQLAAAWWVYRSAKWKVQSAKDKDTQTVDDVKDGATSADPLSTFHLALSTSSLLRAAWPFALAGILAAIQTRSGTILLEQLTSSAQVGYYAAATRFVEAGRMIPNALFGALFPALTMLAQQPDQMRQSLRRMLLGLTLFGSSLGAITMLVAPLIIRLTYGDDFTPAIPVLQVTMWGLLPSLLRGGLTLYAYAIGREQITNSVMVLTIITQMILIPPLIGAYDVSGAALALLMSDAVGCALLVWSLQKSASSARIV